MGVSVLKQGTISHLRVSERLINSNISAIKQMMYLAEDEKRKGKNIISLGVGIPFYRMPESIRSKAIEALQNKPDVDKYSFFAGIHELRQLIAEQESKKLGIPVIEDNILVTPGSMGALFYSMLAVVDKGDEVILLSPYFASYAEQVTLAGGTYKEVPLIEPTHVNDTFHLDIEKIEATITPKTKAVIVNSPNNPTGAVYLKDELIQLAELAKKHDIYIITDEVYEYLIYDGIEYFNIATIRDLWPKIIRCCSFSKKYGMTGWRVGFLHTDAELLKLILKIHDNMIVCANHLGQETVRIALSMEVPELKGFYDAMVQNRNTICERLDKLEDLFTYIKPQGAYYSFPKFNLPLSGIEMAKKLLYEAGVVTIPGIGFGEVSENHTRLSFGGSNAELNEAFDRIEKWWKNYKQIK